MKLMKTFLLISLLIIIVGCEANSGSHGNRISMEEWCDENEDIQWSGCWREIKQINCETDNEFEPEETIGELRIKADGTYSITWHSFEFYTDFIGSYEVNETEGKITFSSNNKAGFDGDGLYLIRENGDLELREIWFATFYEESEPEIGSCGYVFQRK